LSNSTSGKLYLNLLSWLFFGLLSAESAAQEPRLDYVSCAVITSEHLTTLQLFQRGVTLDTALESLPKLSRSGAKRVKYIYSLAQRIGVLNTYADINTNFARCTTTVYNSKGRPFADEKAYGYYFCAGENKLRYEILLHTDRYYNFERVLAKTPSSHHQVAQDYFALIKAQGLLAAFDLTANNLKACLNRLEP